jgi:DNA replication protein DnaC
MELDETAAALAAEQAPFKGILEPRVEVPLPEKPCWGCGAPMGWGFLVLIGTEEIPVYSHQNECEAVTEKLAAEDAERRQQSRWLRRECESGLPEPGGGVILETYGDRYQIDADNEEAVTFCRRFLAACEGERLPRMGFTLAGAWGCGKTELTKALARSLARRGTRILWVNVPDEFESLKGLMRQGGYESRLRTMQRVRVLVLDDLGRERASAWTVDQVLYPVIDARYREGLPTLCTSNETLRSLRDAYDVARGEQGERARSTAAVIDRLRERCPWIVLKGESRRKPQWDF